MTKRRPFAQPTFSPTLRRAPVTLVTAMTAIANRLAPVTTMTAMTAIANRLAPVTRVTAMTTN